MTLLFSPKWFLLAALSIAAFAVHAAAQNSSTPEVKLTTVDGLEAARRIAFVHEEIRVHSGTVTLAYPRWIPGEHGPTGPIQQLSELRIHSRNEALHWTRDPDDIYQFRVEVPSGTDRITVDFAALLQ